MVRGLTVDASGRLTASGSSYTLPTASSTVLGGIKVGNNLSIGGDGTLSATATPYTLPPATVTSLGGVIVGSGLTVDASGRLTASGSSYTLPTASSTVLGGIKVGNNLSIGGDGTLSATATPYTLPPATVTSLGGIIVGSGLTVDASGRLTATGGGGGVQSVGATDTSIAVAGTATAPTLSVNINPSSGLAKVTNGIALVAPTATTLGGVKANTGTAGQFVNGVGADGSLLYGTPSGGGGGGFQADTLPIDSTIYDNPATDSGLYSTVINNQDEWLILHTRGDQNRGSTQLWTSTDLGTLKYRVAGPGPTSVFGAFSTLTNSVSTLTTTARQFNNTNNTSNQATLTGTNLNIPPSLLPMCEDSGFAITVNSFGPNSLKIPNGTTDKFKVNDIIGWVDRPVSNLLQFFKITGTTGTSGGADFAVTLNASPSSGTTWGGTVGNRIYKVWFLDGGLFQNAENDIGYDGLGVFARSTLLRGYPYAYDTKNNKLVNTTGEMNFGGDGLIAATAGKYQALDAPINTTLAATTNEKAVYFGGEATQFNYAIQAQDGSVVVMDDPNVSSPVTRQFTIAELFGAGFTPSSSALAPGLDGNSFWVMGFASNNFRIARVSFAGTSFSIQTSASFPITGQSGASLSGVRDFAVNLQAGGSFRVLVVPALTLETTDDQYLSSLSVTPSGSTLTPTVSTTRIGNFLIYLNAICNNQVPYSVETPTFVSNIFYVSTTAALYQVDSSTNTFTKLRDYVSAEQGDQAGMVFDGTTVWQLNIPNRVIMSYNPTTKGFDTSTIPASAVITRTSNPWFGITYDNYAKVGVWVYGEVPDVAPQNENYYITITSEGQLRVPILSVDRLHINEISPPSGGAGIGIDPATKAYIWVPLPKVIRTGRFEAKFIASNIVNGNTIIPWSNNNLVTIVENTIPEDIMTLNSSNSFQFFKACTATFNLQVSFAPSPVSGTIGEADIWFSRNGNTADRVMQANMPRVAAAGIAVGLTTSYTDMFSTATGGLQTYCYTNIGTEIGGQSILGFDISRLIILFREL